LQVWSSFKNPPDHFSKGPSNFFEVPQPEYGNLAIVAQPPSSSWRQILIRTKRVTAHELVQHSRQLLVGAGLQVQCVFVQ